MSTFNEEQLKKLDGSRENVRKVSSAFKVKRFKLDTAKSKNDFQGDNLFDFAFKSFWIVDTNNTGFIANMIVNPRGDGGDALPLKPNMSIPFEYRQNGCAIECPAQPGVWIDVVFGYDSDILPGFSNFVATSTSIINEGSTFSDSNPTVDATGTSIICASLTSRNKALIQNKSGVSIWVGTTANLSGIDYKKKCYQIDHGFTFEWKNKGTLYARVEAGSFDTVSVMEMS